MMEAKERPGEAMEVVFTPIVVEAYVGDTRSVEAWMLGLSGCRTRPANTPVLRLWGRLGQDDKSVTCHVHGFYPYFYARPKSEGMLATEEGQKKAFAAIRKSLNAALATTDDAFEACGRVRGIETAYLTPAYGYEISAEAMARIELWDHDDVRRAAAILFKSGVEMDGRRRFFQPHESHVDFHMKFFVDMGLFGLQALRCQYVKERSSSRRTSTSNSTLEIDVSAAHVSPVRPIRRSLFPAKRKKALFPSGKEKRAAESNYFTALPSLADLYDELHATLTDVLSSEALATRKLAIADEWLSPSLRTPSADSRVDDRSAEWAPQLERLRRAAKLEPTPPPLNDDDDDHGASGVAVDDALATADEYHAYLSQTEALEAARPFDFDDDDDDQEPDHMHQHHHNAGLDDHEHEHEHEMGHQRRATETDGDDPDDNPDDPAILTAPPKRRSTGSWTTYSPRPTTTQDSSRSLNPKILRPVRDPPKPDAVRDWVRREGLSVAPSWFYSRRSDVPHHHRSYKGKADRAALKALNALPECHLPAVEALRRAVGPHLQHSRKRRRFCVLAPTRLPPSKGAVAAWCQTRRLAERRAAVPPGPTPADEGRTQASSGAGGSAARDKKGLRIAAADPERACAVSTLALEILAACEPEARRSDPAKDAVLAVAWRFRRRYEDHGADDARGALVVGDPVQLGPRSRVRVAADERELLRACCELVSELDPDVFLGWDLERDSFSYLAERGRKLDVDVRARMSRVANSFARKNGDYPAPVSGVEIRGRIGLNGWRAVSRDDAVKMRSYSLEDALQTVCKRTLPRYAPDALAAAATSSTALDRRHAVEHLSRRCFAALSVLSELNTLGRAAELARLLGMPLADAVSRGSQHRVEAVVLRLARPRGGVNPILRRRNDGPECAPEPADTAAPTTRWFALASPNRDQVANQPGLEIVALTLEPRGDIYEDPVAVLDFRSLYPSMMIAYNMCFTTLVCRLAQSRTEDDAPEAPCVHERLGVLGKRSRARSAAALVDAEDGGGRVFVAPNGAVFAPASRREGILPRALREILAARVAVKVVAKQAAKSGRGTLTRVLDARQLALKLLANVTYGYCSASFSGRMPCAELADAIVASGRAALLDAIEMAGGSGGEDNPDPPVRYGDTDSLFIRMRGSSLVEAVEKATELASRVTEAHPAPVELKFEKVLYPCALVAKKRYAGIEYEKAPPDGDARALACVGGHWLCKGLECMRRDQCGFVRKTMETVLRVLFRTRDVSKAKAIFCRAVEAARAGEAPYEDFVYYHQKRPSYKYPEANKVARVVRELANGGDNVLVWERVGYVVVASPDQRLFTKTRDVVHAARQDLPLEVERYVADLVQPLQRVLGLIGVDVRKRWLPHVRVRRPWPRRVFVGTQGSARSGRVNQSLITDFFRSGVCLACRRIRQLQSDAVLCAECADEPHAVASALVRTSRELARLDQLDHRRGQHCLDCAADPLGPRDDGALVRRSTFVLLPITHSDAPCASADCPVAFRRRYLGIRRAEAADACGKLKTQLKALVPPSHRRLLEDYDDESPSF